MPVSLLPSLLLAILLVGYTPGPANLFALHCSMKNGVRKALVMWSGLLTGFTVAAVIAAVVTHEVGAMMGRYVVILKYLATDWKTDKVSDTIAILDQMAFSAFGTYK